MEPYVIPLHRSSPPLLDDDGDGEAGSDEDEFGGFSVCSPPGFADPAEPPPAAKPTTRQKTSCSFNHPVEQSQPASTVSSGSGSGQIDVGGQDCNAESSVHLTNGYADGDHDPLARRASTAGACSPQEETGFADFTVFTEQAAHPWCCGFSPIGSTRQWAGGLEGANLGEQACDHEAVMDSEPRPQCAYEAKENVCTEVKHCERRDVALVQPSQDHHQPQDAAATAAALGFPQEQPHRGEEDGQTSEVQEDGESQREGERSVSAVPQTFSAYESASEDLTSLCDDLSFEGASADLEPNVSSLAGTDWDQTDDEDEELGHYRQAESCASGGGGVAHLSQSEAEKGFHHCNQSATQETTSATSNQSPAVAYTEDGFADFGDGGSEPHGDRERVQTDDVRVQCLGSLPPSDSFADFCSAPTQEDGGGWWAEFQDQGARAEGKTWPQFRDQVGSLQTDGDAEQEQEQERDRAGQCGVTRRNSCQATPSCRVQQLIWTSFPEVVVPAVKGEEEEEEEAPSLGALLHTRHLPESEEEEEEEKRKMPEVSAAQWARRGLWRPNQDVHSAVGLRFQWGGSHTNRCLLRCLGVDTRNIVFVGMKKQPVAVPAFASSLGMLEPTKDSATAVCPPGRTAATAQAPPGPQRLPGPSTVSMQEALPSSQLDWSGRGLSSSQDGCSALNLDCFGPEEGSRSSSSSNSSRSHSPPPGVDRELYELTISKLETSTNSRRPDDTLNRLMSAVETTSTSVRKPQQAVELSEEAGRVIAALPHLSFMRAKVLMFPSVLTPRECSPPVLQ